MLFRSNIYLYLSKAGNTAHSNYFVHDEFHHGGYAKTTDELKEFVSEFNALNDFQIEPIYSGKLFWAIREMKKNNFFLPEQQLLAIHTGGLQYLSAD